MRGTNITNPAGGLSQEILAGISSPPPLENCMPAQETLLALIYSSSALQTSAHVRTPDSSSLYLSSIQLVARDHTTSTGSKPSWEETRKRGYQRGILINPNYLGELGDT